ncbi:MAG: hypothetical protein L6R42_001796 [Xanthoria sp. 1 TBL-2021]|nr:MAG: hypothetical protein L6R42_001796 [Xanthoria sp. 1 TBL-2021]
MGVESRRSNYAETRYSSPLAIIGLAFEFPQEATSEEAFWQMLCDARSASTDFPKDRLNIDAFYHPDESRIGSIPVRGGNFIKDDLSTFDAPFFSINPAEAACMDPQHRKMLETAYHALENGSDTSVYTGCFTNDYLSILQQDYESEQRHAAMGIAPSMLANRLSWFFNFKGTSMNLDSACSSSLVALHLACQDLRTGTASMAVVGGSNLVYHPDFMKMMSSFNFLSPDSRSWSFDKRANGYARGEGTAVLIVKRLEDALRDGDTVRAVVRNTGSNQDGRTPGITQPNQEAQVNLIERTYKQAGIDMEPTRFFEAHGTGTKIGDPVEANAIGTAFRHCRSAHDPLFIGAVKANIGHLEGCSGLAGVIKTILVLEKGVIPPIAGFSSLNELIDAEALHLQINSFGFGGTNAVAVLDDAYHYLELHGLHGYHQTQSTSLSDGLGPVDKRMLPNGDPRDSPLAEHSITNDSVLTRDNSCHPPKLLVWSASDERGARLLGDAYHRYAGQHTQAIDNLAHSLATRRTHLAWRSYLVAGLRNEASTKAVTRPEPVRATADGRIAFLFTGQGAQFIGMGQELIAFPEYRKSMESAEKILKQLGCSWSLTDLISRRTKEFPIDKPEYSQTLVTCLQIALVDLLESFGIKPSVVLGHSSGEIAAAYTAGALSRSSSIKIAYHRGILASKLVGEVNDLAMMAVGLSREHIVPYLDRLMEVEGTKNVAIGCINSPNNVTLTGKEEQLTTLAQWFKESSIFARMLKVPIAYHSSYMDAIAYDYNIAIGQLDSPQRTECVPMISSVTRDIVTVQTLNTGGYWVRNLTSPVDFDAAFSRLLVQSNKKPRKHLGRLQRISRVTHVLEIGPHNVLQGAVRDILLAFSGATKPAYMPSLIRHQDAAVTLLKAVGTLHCAGHQVNIQSVNRSEHSAKPMPPDMPQYPFNHKQSYWKEGRLSKNFRFRETARHDLLGTRNIDWNPQTAQWRNIIRLSELPWLEDHKINGETIFPAAGMVVLAMEASKQLAGDIPCIQGIEIKDANFLHPMKFPRGVDEVETQLMVSTRSEPVAHSSWSHFRLFVLENDSFVECCNGYIQAAAEHTEGRCTARATPFMRGRKAQDWKNDVVQACQGQEQDLYTMLPGDAVQYGPAFRNVVHMRLGHGGQAIAELNLDSWKSKNLQSSAGDYTVHPTTIDGLAQLIVPALAQEQEDLPTMVPTHVASIWVDCKELASLQEARLCAAARCRLRGYRGASADMIATPIGSSSPVIHIDGLETTFISSTAFSNTQPNEQRNLCTRLIWGLDVDMMSHQQVLSECIRERPREPNDAVPKFQSLMLLITAFIQEAVNFVEERINLSLKRHLETYVDWMKYQQQQLCSGTSPISPDTVQRLLDDPDAREQLTSEIENSGVDGFFFMHIGRNLIKVLCAEVDPLDLMFRNGLADRYYEQMLANEPHAYPASNYIDLLCFKNPSMKILEVGAGTGGQTARLLKSMASEGIKKWSRYDYTDISPAFFIQARTKFQEYTDQMNFQVFDVSKDPILQSFAAGSYDLVVASHVLHATDDLDQSLRNVRKLLKPGGKLLLFETTRPEALHIGFAFGLLKGWWSPLDHEVRSKYSPCLTPTEWDRRLGQNGFTGVEVEIPGQQDPRCQYSSIMISSAVGLDIRATDAIEEIALVVDPQSEAQVTAAKLVISNLIAKFSGCNIYTLAELAEADLPASTMVVFLMELESTFLDGISGVEYDHLKSVMSKFTTTLWVTKSTMSTGEPQHHLADGLGRTLASEDSTRKFVNLAFEALEQDPHKEADIISRLLKRIIESPIEQVENNYVVRNGMLQISRISQNSTMNKWIAQNILPRQQAECQFTADTHVSLHLGSPGHLESLEWKSSETTLNESTLQEDEVLVEVRSFGLTLKDYLIATGRLNELDLGTECAGIVQATGAQSDVQPGDRVCCIGTSMSHSAVRVKSNAAAVIPSEMSFAEAASMPSALWMAYHALNNVARLQEGETVLIYQGSSSVGQMAIQLARKIGATVLLLTSSMSKGEFLINKLGVPMTAIFYNKDPSLVSKINQATHRQGVDVVMGPLMDQDSVAFSEILAPSGRLVDTSLRQQPESTAEPSGKVAVNVSRAVVNMADLLERRPAMAHKTFQSAIKMAFESQLKPPQPLHLFEADQLDAAFRHFQQAGTVGKRVIELHPGATIVANVETKPTYSFSDNATYIVAGGLGGLGRSFARWMNSRGARNLILLSRSGVKNEAGRALVDELEKQGVRVATPQVDIGDLGSLTNILAQLAKVMPPVRGCIQATVALRDNLFKNMTYEDWVISTRSKVTGSWNLHQVLPADLDFFVLLSSVNGIFGGRAQANYAAGNTFKDALAHHRIALGRKAVSIDLGLMVAEGVVAENEFLLASMRRIGHLMDIQQEELIAVLDHYCNPNLPLPSDDDAQLLMGIEVPSAVLAKGIDLHHSIHRPMFRHLFRMRPEATNTDDHGLSSPGSSNDGKTMDRAAMLRNATSQNEAASLITGWFSTKVAQVLGLPELDIDPHKPIQTYGIDSLVAIDLKNWLAREMGADMEVFMLLGNSSLETISAVAAEKSRFRCQMGGGALESSQSTST